MSHPGLSVRLVDSYTVGARTKERAFLKIEKKEGVMLETEVNVSLGSCLSILTRALTGSKAWPCTFCPCFFRTSNSRDWRKRLECLCGKKGIVLKIDPDTWWRWCLSLLVEAIVHFEINLHCLYTKASTDSLIFLDSTMKRKL